ncbi:MAG: hypothetical protein V4727_10020 [Verrucomicrobiota bacterium]
MKFLSRLLSSQAICIKKGKAISLKGKHTNRHLSEIASLCEENGVYEAEIWLSGNRKITFSSEIPEKIHQRLRNLIINSN